MCVDSGLEPCKPQAENKKACNMKKYLTLLLIIFTNIVSAQDSYDCSGRKANERRYQILLKRWHEGADGQGQGGPVDSVVLNRVKSFIFGIDSQVIVRDAIRNSQRILKVYEDLQRYRGLGIFCGVDTRPTSVKVLKEYYNIDIKDIKKFVTWNTGVEYFYGSPEYMLVCVQLSDEEQIFYLYSSLIGEVLSTYKEKIKKPSPLEQKECEGKDMHFIEFIGPDSVKITEF